MHGEGTEATGDFFQISNQITLGRSETDFVEDFSQAVIPKIVAYERAAREALLKHRCRRSMTRSGAPSPAEERPADQLERGHAVPLARAHGAARGRLSTVDLQTLNELFLQVQPAHLQKLHGERLSASNAASSGRRSSAPGSAATKRRKVEKSKSPNGRGLGFSFFRHTGGSP